MKKLIYSVLALAAMALTFASCTNDDAPAEEYVQVSYTAKLPEGISSRAIGNGETVTHVACAVYDADNGDALVLGPDRVNNQVIELTESGVATFTPTLIKGRKYKIAFWAFYNPEGNAAYVVYNEDGKVDLTSITKNGNWLCNDETADAFTDVIEECLSGTTTKPVKLTRPFARLRFGMTSEDWDNTSSLVTTPTHTSMTLSDGFYTSFNALTGEPIGQPTTTQLKLNEVTEETYEVGGTEYQTLAFSYVLMPEGEENKIETVTVEIKGGKEGGVPIASTTISSIPLQEGYNTNVSGNLLTGSVSYTITIDSSDSGTNNETKQ